MKKNITILIEEALAREAKVLAAKKHFLKLTRKKRVLNYGQRNFQRASLHER